MKTDEWLIHPEDGLAYRIRKVTPEGVLPWRFSLEWSADYIDKEQPSALKPHPLDKVYVAEDNISEVEDSAFNDWDHQSAFAAELGKLFDCFPATIVRAI